MGMGIRIIMGGRVCRLAGLDYRLDSVLAAGMDMEAIITAGVADTTVVDFMGAGFTVAIIKAGTKLLPEFC
jgi:hypothetical protein